MSWEIPVLKPIGQIPQLALAKWFLGFIFVLVIVFFICLALYYIGVDKSIFQYGLISGIVLFILFGIAVGWNVLRISSLAERNEMILLSNQKVENACRTWMSEYLSVIDFSYIYPNDIDIDSFRLEEPFSIVGEKAIKFPDNVNYTSVFQELLCPLRHKLIALSSDDQLEINFAVPVEMSYSLWNAFLFAWKNLYIPESVLNNTVFVVNQFTDQVDEWLESSDTKYRLIVFCNPLRVDDPDDSITDGACAWLLAPTAAPAPCSEIFRLYRAMKTEEHFLKTDLINLIKYQDGMNHSERVLFSNVKSKLVVNEIMYQCNSALRINNDEAEVQQCFSQLIIGRQGVGNIWMAVTLAYLKNTGHSAVNLVVSQEDARLTLVQIRSMPDNKEQL
ncbi:hypothetical protein HVX06_22035 (plasmid) [Enterobacter sp. RHB15-C17]|nr:hypothetical protein HVX06_22035 [Enterobacter sp. RHB15-C17]